MIPAMKTTTSHQAVAVTASGRATRVWASVAGVVGFALLTAVGANIAIPLPGTPVPITLQTFFVLLAGITLGPRLGLASMAFYLLLGTTGYHVFALGSVGLATVFGATGGYLIGFVLAQPLLGWLAQRGRGHRTAILGAALAGNAIIFAAGLLWLSLWLGTGWWQTLALGLWPFVPGGIAMTVGAAAVGPVARRAARRFLDAR
jgi:biotin transport system substrate-specific component